MRLQNNSMENGQLVNISNNMVDRINVNKTLSPRSTLTFL